MEVPSFLACPECRGELAVAAIEPLPPPFASTTGVECRACKRQYPYVDGVWVLWSDQVRRLQIGAAPGAGDSVDDRVKWANISIYDEISDDYGEHNDGARAYEDTVLFLRALADVYRRGRSDRPRVTVDVGCATGIGLHAGTSAYDHVVGVDISFANLREVARKGYTAVLADAASLPFASASVDVITIFAALHHLPDHGAFVGSAHAALRTGGVLLIGCEPSRAASSHRGLGKVAWEARKPVYRLLSRYSDRFYLHKDSAQQDLNDLAEHHRTLGGFDDEQLDGLLQTAGFAERNIFYDLDHRHRARLHVPGWKKFVLKALGGQNPLDIRNTANLSALARKA